MCCKKLKKTAHNAARIARGFTYLAAGVNEELSKKRMRICNNCPHFVGGMVCNICGCEMHAKTRLPEEQCADSTNRRWKQENYSK